MPSNSTLNNVTNICQVWFDLSFIEKKSLKTPKYEISFAIMHSSGDSHVFTVAEYIICSESEPEL